MDKDKKYKVLFAPGTLEMLEDQMSPEDLQEMMDMLKRKIEDGKIVDLNDVKDSDPELYDILIERLEALGEESDDPIVH